MERRDRVLGFTAGLLRVLIVLNLVIAAAFALALIASFPGAQLVIDRIAQRHAGSSAVSVLNGLRGMLLLGMAASLPAHLIFTRLASVLRSVRVRETFAAGNAAHVRTIGWALLAIQLLDLPLVVVLREFRTLGVATESYTPSVGGWLSVLVAFILARVFADGAALREDLEGTV